MYIPLAPFISLSIICLQLGQLNISLLPKFLFIFPWKILCYIEGFESYEEALSFEIYAKKIMDIKKDNYICNNM
jgi:hypothetical protein